MKVPTGQFGFKVGVPSTDRVPAASVPVGAFGVGDAVRDLGRTGVAVASDMLDEQGRAAARVEAERKRLQAQADAEYKRTEEQARRNGTAATYAQYQVDLVNYADSIETRLSDGQLKREDAAKEFDDGLAKLKAKHIDGLDPLSKAELADNLILFDNKAKIGFQRSLRQNARQERVANFTTGVEALERLAATDRFGALRQAEIAFKTEGTALLGADGATKQMQAFRERVAVTDYSQQILEARGSVKALNAVEARLAKESDLDPDKRTVLTGRVMSMRETLLAKAERAEQSRLRTVERSINSLSDLTLKGYDPTPEQLLPVIQAAKGTELEGAAKSLLNTIEVTAKFRATPTAGQETMLSTFEQQVRKNPTPGNVEALEKMKAIHSNQKAEIRDDPITFAARKGLADVQPLDLTKPDTLGAQLAARLDIAGGMRARYGANLQVLTREESGMLTRFLKDATLEQKRGYLAQLAGALPNKEAYSTLMQQIAPDDPVLAVAGIYAARGLESTKGRTVADYILRGQAGLNPPTKEDGKPIKAVVPMPPERDMLSAFASYEQNAFAGKEQARNAYFQSARAIYAAKAIEEGDFTGEMNTRRWDTAMALATGGIDKYRGRAIVMPYGVTMGDFKDQVKDRTEALVAAGKLDAGMSAAKLRDLPLENVGDGRYVFRAGDSVLAGKDGKPIVLDLNTPAGR